MKEINIMSNNLSKKKWVCVIVGLILVGTAIMYISPIAFVSDGVLTRKKVNEYKMQYDLGATRRHDYQATDIYLVYFGFEKVLVQKEDMHEGYDIELVRIMPFLYRWKREPKESVFRVTIGNKKYYYTIVST
ncbi:hypothetical protein [Sporofaciens sp. JLR.KK001]|jgi:hypothetical protein|uniref:hypothetical protein n=1 Tax=Sporofaciens sp. JLR.KK001 TaxID=3112621 RepID=UPI002FEEB103